MPVGGAEYRVTDEYRHKELPTGNQPVWHFYYSGGTSSGRLAVLFRLRMAPGVPQWPGEQVYRGARESSGSVTSRTILVLNN